MEKIADQGQIKYFFSKVAAVALSLALVLLLAGCSSSETESTDANETTTSTPAETEYYGKGLYVKWNPWHISNPEFLSSYACSEEGDCLALDGAEVVIDGVADGLVFPVDSYLVSGNTVTYNTSGYVEWTKHAILDQYVTQVVVDTQTSEVTLSGRFTDEATASSTATKQATGNTCSVQGLDEVNCERSTLDDDWYESRFAAGTQVGLISIYGSTSNYTDDYEAYLAQQGSWNLGTLEQDQSSANTFTFTPSADYVEALQAYYDSTVYGSAFADGTSVSFEFSAENDGVYSEVGECSAGEGKNCLSRPTGSHVYKRIVITEVTKGRAQGDTVTFILTDTSANQEGEALNLEITWQDNQAILIDTTGWFSDVPSGLNWQAE